MRRGGPGQCRRARNRDPGPEGDTAAVGRGLSQTAVRLRASPCRSPRSMMHGDPQTLGLHQPHFPGPVVLGSPGRSTRLISVSPPGLLEGSSPVNPEPLIPASPVGISLPGPFLIQQLHAAPPRPRVAGRASPLPRCSLLAWGVSARLGMPGPKLSSKLWGDLGMQIKVVTKETASKCPG